MDYVSAKKMKAKFTTVLEYVVPLM